MVITSFSYVASSFSSSFLSLPMMSPLCTIHPPGRNGLVITSFSYVASSFSSLFWSLPMMSPLFTLHPPERNPHLIICYQSQCFHPSSSYHYQTQPELQYFHSLRLYKFLSSLEEDLPRMLIHCQDPLESILREDIHQA